MKWKCFQESLQRLASDWVLTLVLETSLATKPRGLVLNLALETGQWRMSPKDWGLETGPRRTGTMEMGPETGTLRLGAGAWSLDWRMEMVCYALHLSTHSGFIGYNTK